MLIHTKRLRLITCDEQHLTAIAQGVATLAEQLRVSIPDEWPGYPAAYARALTVLKKRPMLPYSGWWLYLFLNPALNALVGSGGFKEAPDRNGVVEIGCEIAPVYRRQNFAAEGLRGLTRYAFTRPEVRAVDAYSLPAKGAQSATLGASGMKRIGEAMHVSVGKVWHWRVTREESDALALANRH